ncbi:phage virion morphogenesis protein, partial [Salmonella enterica subsp. enterica]
KAKGSDSAAVVEFTGRVQRMARVHQYGLKDRPNRHSRDVQYAARQLLGFSRDDEKIIESLIILAFGSG